MEHTPQASGPSRIVIWGLRTRYHTHRHIHKAYYETAKALGYETLWLEDEKENVQLIKSGDLIIASEVQGRMVAPKEVFEDYNLPVRTDVRYCFHNLKKVFTDNIDPSLFINLAVYQKSVEREETRIDTARYYDSSTRTLYQPWGTDLLPNRFKKPTFSRLPFVFWIGSVWNNSSKQGNSSTIAAYSKMIKKFGLRFVAVRFVPDWVNVLLVRLSRLAPAITGEYQEEVQYLPCRMFKNISYGQLGFSNIRKFNDILGDASVYSPDLEEMTKKILSLSKAEYLDIVRRQQEAIKDYTYKSSIEHIVALLYTGTPRRNDLAK